jgi:hypothetical protein
MPILFALLLATAFPSNSPTSWMRPESFHLAIGMSRMQVADAMHAWELKPGANANELVVDYGGDKSLTLEFRNARLRSIRFELFTLLPQIRTAFNETREHLRTTRGAPRKATSSILIYDNVLPNVMVVVNDDPKTENGQKGLGLLAVRYYDPR